MAWVSEVCFLVSTCSTKVSILLFYRRLVRGTVTKRWRYAIFGAIILAVLYCLTFIILLLTNCQPVDAYWYESGLQTISCETYADNYTLC